jgi:oligopeptide transport system ATP-binding protein
MNALLEIRDLTVTYTIDERNQIVVNQVNVDIAKGEIVTLLGETGSGKSTIGLSIMGLLPPNGKISKTSSIRFSGKEIFPDSGLDWKSVRGKQIGMVFQNPLEAMNPVLRCGAQVLEALRIHKRISKAVGKKLVISLFERLELKDTERMFRAYPHELSIGQLQRINIAMALIMKPALLIADEPFSSIDAVNQISLARLFKNIREEMGTSILLITHNLAMTNICADRWQVLYKGVLVDKGEGAILRSNPTHAYARNLVQSHLKLRKGTEHGNEKKERFLECNALTYAYQKPPIFSKIKNNVIEQIAFQLEKGKTLGIIGESGSGKSTVSQIIGGLIPDYQGSVLLEGKDIRPLVESNPKQHFRKVQYIMQDAPSSLPPKRQIYQILTETIKAFYPAVSKSECMEEAARLMGEVQLEKNYLYRFPYELSGGEKQRICIARALAVKAKLLILDESLNSLDKHIQSKIIELLKHLRVTKDLTMILVAHEIPLIYYFCEKIIILEKGKIVESGWTYDVVNRPRSEVAKKLIEAGL